MAGKLFFASFLFAVLFLFPGAYAVPVISNLTVSEPDLWLGESAAINLECSDDANVSITQVSSSITGPSIILPEMNFSSGGNTSSSYSLVVPSSYLDRTGVFDVTVYCFNNASENSSSSTSFTISNLSSGVNSASTPLYIGDVAEIDFNVKKDGSPLSSGVSFNVTVDGQPTPLYQNQLPAYDGAKGWILKLSTSALSAGNHSVVISAGYGRASTQGNAILEMRNPIEFAVTNIDRTEVQSGNEIVVSMRAKERGNPIVVTAAYLSAQVDSAAATISGIQGSSGNYDVRIVAPSFSSGSRQLKVTFSYGNYTSTYTKSITYVVPVSGKILGADSKGLSVQFVFRSSSVEKKVNTDSTGAYSTYLAPGNYSMTMTHDSSTLDLDNLDIADFDDPIKYTPLPNLNVPGIKEAGVYVYEVALRYSGAHVRMKYDEGKVSDESALRVYECSNWNSGRQECVSGWSAIASSIDTIRNLARSDVSALHAYAIGVDDTVSVDAGLDKETYLLNDVVKLSGIVRDSGGNGVVGANITASVEGTGKTATATSGAGGVYSLQISPPQAEGKYALAVNIAKPPYVAISKRLEFTVSKTRTVSVVAPEVIRLKPGESATSEFKVVNTGQADLSNIKISVGGIPSNYYTVLTQSISSLKSGEEKQVSVAFNIPQDATKATLGGSLDLSGGISSSQVFGLTISSQSESSNSNVAQSNSSSAQPDNSSGFNLSFPTAFLAAYQPSSDIVNLLILAVVSFASALILRSRRISKPSPASSIQNQGHYLSVAHVDNQNQNKTAARNMLFDIKKRVVEPRRKHDRTLQPVSPTQEKKKDRKSIRQNIESAKRW